MAHISEETFPFDAELTHAYTGQHAEAIVGLDVSVTAYTNPTINTALDDTPHTYEVTFTEVGGSQDLITLFGVSPLHLTVL